MSLALLAGHWRDEQGSTYDVSLDCPAAQGCSRCSVKITRPAGHVKDARGVVKEARDGSILWNNKYVINTASRTSNFVEWTSLHGNRGFVWTRIQEPSTAGVDLCSPVHHPARNESKSDATHSTRKNPKSNKIKGNDSVPRALGEDCTGKVSSISLERLVGSWCDDAGTQYETTLDSPVTGAESCTVKITKVDKPPHVAAGVIILKSAGSISWGDRYILDLHSEAHMARWIPMNGGKSFVWFRKAALAEDAESVKASSSTDETIAAMERACLPEDSLYNADSMVILRGRWSDRNGWMYDVVPDIPAQAGEASCTVRIKKGCRLWSIYPGLIHLTRDGYIAWSGSHFLDGLSSSRTFVRWRSVDDEVSFVWFRRDAAASAALPDKVSGDLQSLGGEMTLPHGHRNIVPHFCIFESMNQGIKGWSRQGGVNDDLWSGILLSLLQCVMMDGAWLQEVTASAFVGPDAVHISGAMQQLAMPQVWRNGKTKTCPATPDAWEELLWQRRGKNSPGLHWELEGPACAASDWMSLMLSRVNAMLDRSSPDAVALVFYDRHVDVTYDELRLSGIGLGARAQDVFLLMGSSHGFGSSAAEDPIVGCFKSRLGSDRVVRVNLCPVKASTVSIPIPKVASFLSTEFSRGSLANVVAGLESRRGEWWQ